VVHAEHGVRAAIEDEVLPRARLLIPDRRSKPAGNVRRNGADRLQDLRRPRVKSDDRRSDRGDERERMPALQ
jgi:hypothetical protein